MIIPINELTISPTIADINQVVPEEDSGTWNNITVPYTTATSFHEYPAPSSSSETIIEIIGGDDVKVFAVGRLSYYVFSRIPATIKFTNVKTEKSSEDRIYQHGTTLVSGDDFYYLYSTGVINIPTTAPVIPMYNKPNAVTTREMATALYDGEQTHQEGGQHITVSWPRYGDGLVLTDTFTIQVSSDDESQGENS